jgi:hypothetical protein
MAGSRDRRRACAARRRRSAPRISVPHVADGRLVRIARPSRASRHASTGGAYADHARATVRAARDIAMTDDPDPCAALRARALEVRGALRRCVEEARPPERSESANVFIRLEGRQRELGEELGRIILAMREAGCPGLPPTVER